MTMVHGGTANVVLLFFVVMRMMNFERCIYCVVSAKTRSTVEGGALVHAYSIIRSTQVCVYGHVGPSVVCPPAQDKT